MRNRQNRRTPVIAAVIVLIASISLTACGDKEDNSSYTDDIDTSFDKDDINTDIDLDALSKSVDSIKDLNLTADLGTDTDNKAASDEDAENDNGNEGDESMSEPKGDKTVYSYAYVYRDGNSLAVIPNGGMNSSTELFAGKDLDGFLDYVDSTVLEAGRTINRDFFYDILATMLVDKDLSSDQSYIEKHLIMAIAVANNFHDTPIKIHECDLDANNATDYSYKLTAYEKDDTWVFNFANRTLYMNNGKTEYVSDMFKDEYMAVWLMAVDEYFNLKMLD